MVARSKWAQYAIRECAQTCTRAGQRAPGRGAWVPGQACWVCWLPISSPECGNSHLPRASRAAFTRKRKASIWASSNWVSSGAPFVQVNRRRQAGRFKRTSPANSSSWTVNSALSEYEHVPPLQDRTSLRSRLKLRAEVGEPSSDWCVAAETNFHRELVYSSSKSTAMVVARVLRSIVATRRVRCVGSKKPSDFSTQGDASRTDGLIGSSTVRPPPPGPGPAQPTAARLMSASNCLRPRASLMFMSFPLCRTIACGVAMSTTWRSRPAPPRHRRPRLR